MPLPDESHLRSLLNEWRANHWPPQGSRQIGRLQIFICEHDTLTRIAESLAPILEVASDLIESNERSRPPRWMRVPKLVFQVERLNIAQTESKASRRFTTIEALVAHCGSFSDAGYEKVRDWFSSNPDGQLVCHKVSSDLRAYVFARGKAPERHRFHRSGLVLAAPPGNDVLVQDHRKTVRAPRSDALRTLATSSNGFLVVVPRKSPGADGSSEA